MTIVDQLLSKLPKGWKNYSHKNDVLESVCLDLNPEGAIYYQIWIGDPERIGCGDTIRYILVYANQYAEKFDDSYKELLATPDMDEVVEYVIKNVNQLHQPQ